VDEVLRDLSPFFDEMYAELGRPSVPRERLLKAKVLQAFYTIRSEARLVEAFDYNLLFRWFLDLNLLDPIWDNSSFRQNQNRLLQHRAAELFFARLVALAHFTVDGTLQTRSGPRGFERPGDPEQLQSGADGQAAGQSATTDELGDRVSGTPEPAVCPETVETQSDTSPQAYAETQNGGHSCGNHQFFKSQQKPFH
jgi:hypothetical protein